MSTNETFGRTLTTWLHEDAENRVPDHLAEVLVRTAATGQRPWWSSPERWLPVDLTARASSLAPPRLGRVLLIAILVLALLGLAIAVGSRPQRLPAPYGPAENGVIFYAAEGDIWAADVDPNTDFSPRIVVGGPGDDGAVVASPDGTRILVARGAASDAFDLLVADADGQDVRVLTPRPLVGLASADWSPDGDLIVAFHRNGGLPTLSILSADGDPSMRDLHLGDVSPEYPTDAPFINWRPPDGQEIVFRGVRDGQTALYAIGVDGGGLRALTSELPDESGPYLGLRFSPDGARVTYWHNLPAETPDGTKSEVHVLNLQTRQDLRVGYDPTSRHELLPRFSPDGRSVLFARFNREPAAATLHIVAADGSGGARQVGPLQTWGLSWFDFSPDGRKVYLAIEGQYLQVIDIASGEVDVGKIAAFPSWQRLAVPSD